MAGRDLPGHYILTETGEIEPIEEYLGEDFLETLPGYDPGCEMYDEAADMCMEWLYSDEEYDDDDEVEDT